MKRVKIMLSGILVLAVVAGAMAFNVSKKSNACLFTYDNSQNPAVCVLVAGNATITPSTVVGATTTLGTVKVKQSGQQCSALAIPPTSQCSATITTIAGD